MITFNFMKLYVKRRKNFFHKMDNYIMLCPFSFFKRGQVGICLFKI